MIHYDSPIDDVTILHYMRPLLIFRVITVSSTQPASSITAVSSTTAGCLVPSVVYAVASKSVSTHIMHHYSLTVVLNTSRHALVGKWWWSTYQSVTQIKLARIYYNICITCALHKPSARCIDCMLITNLHQVSTLYSHAILPRLLYLPSDTPAVTHCL
jgi:hypothetical protein